MTIDKIVGTARGIILDEKEFWEQYFPFIKPKKDETELLHDKNEKVVPQNLVNSSINQKPGEGSDGESGPGYVDLEPRKSRRNSTAPRGFSFDPVDSRESMHCLRKTTSDRDSTSEGNKQKLI